MNREQTTSYMRGLLLGDCGPSSLKAFCDALQKSTGRRFSYAMCQARLRGTTEWRFSEVVSALRHLDLELVILERSTDGVTTSRRAQLPASVFVPAQLKTFQKKQRKMRRILTAFRQILTEEL